MPGPTKSQAPAIPSRTPLAVLAVAGLAMVTSAAAPALAQSTIEWASPVDGDFSVAGNWFPAVVPGDLDTAVLGGVGSYVVTLNATTAVGAISLSNPEATLQLRQGRELTVGGLTGGGLLVINDPGSFAPAALVVQDGVTLNGNVRLEGSSEIRGLGSSHNLGPNAVITGVNGFISGPWTSEAHILKDGSGIFDFTGLNAIGGTLRSSDDGRLILNNATLTNVTIEAGPGSWFDTNSATTISDSTIVGTYTIRQSDEITWGDGVVNPDGLILNEDGSFGTARLLVQDGVTLNSEISLLGAGGSEIRGLGGSHVLGPDVVITGASGSITGPWTSEADILKDGPGTFDLTGLEAIGGTLRSSDNGLLVLNNATLTNVTIEAGLGGRFDTNADTVVTDSTINGTYTIRQGEEITWGAGVENPDGLILNDPSSFGFARLLVQDGVTLNSRMTLLGAGGSEIRGLGGSHALGPDAVITGQNGSITGAWTSEATIAMGDASTPVGRINLNSTYEMGSRARLEVDAAGTSTSQHDRIDGTGTITLGGSLDVDFVDGYVPEPRDQFEIISATTIDGFFTDIDIEPVGAIGPAHVVYTGDSVIVVICAADRDADGELTIFDFLAFQNLFDAGDLRADLDQDGQLTIFDFLVYQNRFAAGCG